MKRIIALILALGICLTLCACGQGGGNKNTGNGTDLAAAITNGKIPEIDIVLGTAVDTVTVAEGHSHESGEEAYGYSFVEGNQYSYFLNEHALAYYKNSKKAQGISVVLSVSEAFGLRCKNFVSAEDVKAAFPSIEFTEAVVEDDDLTIYPYMLDTTEKLTYESGKRRAVFYLMDDQLIAVAIIDTENWN